MSHFAKVINGKVVSVIVAEQDFIDNYADKSDGVWIQTSYNTRLNVHYGPDGNPDGGIALRGNYACIGYIYDEQNDVFYMPQPYPSWVLNKSIWVWEPPTSMPNDGKIYIWNEETQSWVEVTGA